MRVVVLYKTETDYARQVTDFLYEFKRITGRDIDTMDPESSEGISFCGAYDILQFPTVVALSDDGHMQNQWSGLPLPTISEVSYYV